ncbi:PREDICTED: uncharacterized protein LOC109218949 [Nicotiana attenuata]|uniref:uncharacterized protein LOC109218949 n=1 Tax=Nicotiana attenuata TaxID=49451 RepID=UPI00090556B9|nr:PREDICTED: uncharacterized protein LOC109218949 [Nicotiana attenuata]
MGTPIDSVNSSSSSTTVAPRVSPTTGVVDSSHPYYIHPSDYPGMNLVTSVFDGKNYGGWRRAVVIALSAKNKLGFIDGTLTVPPADSGLQRIWARCNDMVLSWLLNSLSKDIAESVLYSQSAKDLWSDLEDRFGQTNGAKLFQLQKELSAVVQGNTSISTYFTKMKSLWDELDALNTFSACICNCECGAKAKSVKAHQDERLLQFLMGLNDTFIGVRRNILLSSPLPSIGQAYSLVIQDKKHREIHAAPVYPGDSASFLTPTHFGNFRKYNEDRGQKGRYDQKKNSEMCYMASQQIFKFTKQRKFQGTVQANNAFTGNNEMEYTCANATENQILTQDNVAQLLKLLQQMKAGQLGTGSSDANANLSCAGIAKFFNSYACLIQINCESWILDSGATEHMTFNKDFFTNFKALPKPLMVKLPNSYRVKGPSLKSPLEIGKEKEGLYILNSRSSIAASKDLPKSSNDDKLWHYRLGHMPLSNMKNISSVSVPSCLNFSTPCTICPMARQCYPHGKKGYKLLNLQSFKTFVSRNVIFHEEFFPYASLKSDCHDELPLPVASSPTPGSHIPDFPISVSP